MANIKPGGMGDKKADPNTKPPEFAGSMAEAIENALNDLLASEKPPMKTFTPDTNSQEARDRRRLFVAISLGMMRYLQQNMDAFQIVDSSNNPTGESIVMHTDPPAL